MRGPIYWDIQASVGKTFKVGDTVKIQAKLSAFNLTNRLNRADPILDVTSSTFGTALRQGTGTQTGTNAISGRQIELVLKIIVLALPRTPAANLPASFHPQDSR